MYMSKILDNKHWFLIDREKQQIILYIYPTKKQMNQSLFTTEKNLKTLKIFRLLKNSKPPLDMETGNLKISNYI
jgi:hypothetical protein